MPSDGPGSRRLRLLFFGTYDATTHPRVQVLMDGCTAHGDEVVQCNVPLRVGTAARVRALQRPYLVPVVVARLARTWAVLALRAWRLRRRGEYDAVIVGYLGHFDVHLARWLFRTAPVVLDQMVFAADTAADRRIGGGWLSRVLAGIDRAAVAAADITLVDTSEHLALVPVSLRRRAVVVPVGAPDLWFREPLAPTGGPLRVIFFGLYTPLQGAPTIGAALALLAGRDDIRVTMAGRGQELDQTRQAAAGSAWVTWVDWLAGEELPATVAAHEVCLGIFGTSRKATRVVPNKVFQGASLGCAIVTSETAPQRAALGDDAEFVPAGDAGAIAAVLGRLADDRDHLWDLRSRSHQRAERHFRPARVVQPMRQALTRSVR
jgi:glycosyltransferase involved in cell wall biosynthesis